MTTQPDETMDQVREEAITQIRDTFHVGRDAAEFIYHRIFSPIAFAATLAEDGFPVQLGITNPPGFGGSHVLTCGTCGYQVDVDFDTTGKVGLCPDCIANKLAQP